MAGPRTETFRLDEFLSAERERVERALGRVGDEVLADAPAGLAEPIRYALGSGGKRLRPILCVAAWRAAGGAASGARPDPIYEIGCAIEMVHGYSLVHDDLPCMDDDELRRGRPTTHRVFGNARATLAGAALVPLACRVLERGGRRLGLSADRRMRLVGELCAAAGAGGMVGGQLLDLEAEGREIDVDELARIHGRKTGALLAVSLRLGGLAAGAQPAEIEALDDYGRAVGLAFQIADDVLDATGDSEVLGKTTRRDQALGKATYASLVGLGAARRRAHERADAAVAALRGKGLATPELEALARYAVERDR